MFVVFFRLKNYKIDTQGYLKVKIKVEYFSKMETYTFNPENRKSGNVMLGMTLTNDL